MLSFSDVSYRYSFQAENAVSRVSFQVNPGELVLCTGASGCGKSTLIRLANGLCPQFFKGELSGEILADGLAAPRTPLHLLADKVGTLFQNPEEQFFALKVEDELVFAHEWRNLPRRETGRLLHKAARGFGLEKLLESSVHQLSQGQKQKVGLASLMSRQPRILILDEPTANLDPEATAELAQKLLELKKSGLAILVVDHRLYWLDGVADKVLVMRQGRVEQEGPFAILRDRNLREFYGLRRDWVEDARPALPAVPGGRGRSGLAEPAAEQSASSTKQGQPGRPGLCVRGLSFAYPGKEDLFSEAWFDLPPGVTALIGDNGRGKTTLARLLTGLNRCRSGEFQLDGTRLEPGALMRKTGLVLQNADHQLYMRSAREELETCFYLADAQYGRGGKGKKRKAGDFREKALELLELFDLRVLAERHPQSLSGGEKQRLVIACALAKGPDVLILDEPTSGLDGRNMRRIAQALEMCAARKTCVLVITHDLELLSTVCARALRLPLEQNQEPCAAALKTA